MARPFFSTVRSGGRPMIPVLQHIGLVLLYLFIFFADILTFVGLPGSWIAFGAIVIYTIATRFSSVGWPTLLVLAGIMIVAEVVEWLLGLVYVYRKGATRWGVLGAFVGGLVGAIGGTAIVPLLGSVVFGLAGAFGGAVLFEYLYYRSLDRALRTGFFAFMGKLNAMFAKFALSLLILGIFIFSTWP